MSHTPGPWIADHSNRQGTGWTIKTRDGISIATIVATSNRPVAEKQANAHLIAAASELLVALESVIAYAENSRQLQGCAAAIAKARAAIQKAQGE